MLYGLLADFYFRRRSLWSAKGKSIPRQLAKVNPKFQRRFSLAFDKLFANGNTGPVIRLAEEVLKPAGGFLFEGYTVQAPKKWRG